MGRGDGPTWRPSNSRRRFSAASRSRFITTATCSATSPTSTTWSNASSRPSSPRPTRPDPRRPHPDRGAPYAIYNIGNKRAGAPRSDSSTSSNGCSAGARSSATCRCSRATSRQRLPTVARLATGRGLADARRCAGGLARFVAWFSDTTAPRTEPPLVESRPSQGNSFMLLVTGGAGFIGSNFVLDWLRSKHDERVVNLDKLTYAGNLANLGRAGGRPAPRLRPRRHRRRAHWSSRLLAEHRPRAVVQFRRRDPRRPLDRRPGRTSSRPTSSAPSPARGGARLLDERCRRPSSDAFRFLHVSTDEVYGSLGADDPAFTEDDALRAQHPLLRVARPAADHLVRAYHHTYGLPTLITNCSNNYGPYQFPEKLIPLMILNALDGQAAAGLRRRPATCATGCTSSDHCARHPRSSSSAARSARPTTSAASNEQPNLEVVRTHLRAPRRARRARTAQPTRR